MRPKHFGLLLAGVAIVVMVAALVMPTVHHPSTRSRIRANLNQLDHAAKLWAFDHGYTNAATPTKNDLTPYVREGWGKPVADEEYILRPYPLSPEAHLIHAIDKYPKGTIFRLNTNGGIEVFPPE